MSGNMETLEELALAQGVEIVTLRRFVLQVAGDLKNVDMTELGEEDARQLVSETIDSRHVRNMGIIEDCLTHPAEAAALVFKGIEE